VVASLALSAGCLRMAVLGDYSGWHSLKAGADEGRIFIVGLLIIVLILIVSTIAFMFWAAVVNLIANGALRNDGVDPETAGLSVPDALAYLGSAEWAVVATAGAAALGVLVWMVARLVLAFPATIEQGEVVVLKAWPLSHGSTLRIAAATALAILPLLLVETGLYELVCAALGSRPLELSNLAGPDELNLPIFAAFREYQLWNGFMAFINVPVFSGLYAYIYRNRTAAAPARDKAV
jgi:hypothetical protein